MNTWTNPLMLLIMAGLAFGTGCQSAYYRTWEAFGWEKRHLLVDEVKETRDEQQAAKEQFASALESFIAVTQFEGGDLQAKYEELSDEYEESRKHAEAVRGRIDRVERVGEDLFSEWEDELELYQSDELRRASERQHRATRRQYDQLIRSMRAAESKMEPVLRAFHDQVLFLKHNLNARAIASLEDTATSIRDDVAQLIREMETSIEEANAFIEQMGVE